MHAGEEIGVDDVVAGAVDDHVFVAFRRARFLRRDEGRADIAEVGAGSLSREYGATGGYCTRECKWTAEPFANLLDQREGRKHAGMSAGAGCDRDDTVGAFLDRFSGKA